MSRSTDRRQLVDARNSLLRAAGQIDFALEREADVDLEHRVGFARIDVARADTLLRRTWKRSRTVREGV